MNLTIQQIIDVIFSIFGSRFQGYHTKIFAILNGIAGAMLFFQTQVAEYVCTYFKVLCDLEDQKWFGGFLIVYSVVTYTMRKFQTTPAAPMGQFYKRFTPAYKEEVQKLRKR